MIDADFFKHLKERLPRRAAEIDVLERAWLSEARIGVESSGGTTSVTPPGLASAVERPRIDPLPPDDWSDIPARFIGRELSN